MSTKLNIFTRATGRSAQSPKPRFSSQSLSDAAIRPVDCVTRSTLVEKVSYRQVLARLKAISIDHQEAVHILASWCALVSFLLESIITGSCTGECVSAFRLQRPALLVASDAGLPL